MSAETTLTIAQLLAEVDKATAATRATIEGCSTAQWETVVEEEGRTAGVVLHHIAYAFPFVVQWAVGLVQGDGAPAVTYDDVHALNQQHAGAQANVDAAAALALLENNAAAARDALGKLTDADLQASAPFDLIGGQPITTQQMIQWFMVNHAHNHIAAIHQALGGS